MFGNDLITPISTILCVLYFLDISKKRGKHRFNHMYQIYITVPDTKIILSQWRLT